METVSTELHKDPTTGRYFVPWLLLATCCIVAMWMFRGDETIPYHIAWAGFALAYGSTPWSGRRSVIGLTVFTIVTGGILLIRVAQGSLAWQETAEIPLMSLLMVLLVWNIQQRQTALSAVSALASLDRVRASQREYLTRLTSHEMRTPLTIARGYTEVLHRTEPDPSRQRDLEVVMDELDRLARVGDRMIRMIHLQGSQIIERVDVDRTLYETAERWATIADRSWVVDSTAGHGSFAPERLRACLDTIIENAIRYTRPGDTIRLVGTRSRDYVGVGVADSGPGFSPAQLTHLNQHGSLDPTHSDPLTQTGLGLGLVSSYALARGGRAVFAVAPEGGALVVLQVPSQERLYAQGYAAGTGARSPELADRGQSYDPAPSGVLGAPAR